ncbi:hypothetical protein [Nocardioides taihuensis]|uniref:HEAT repeat domain-containing protein n=1 Tax=Nocardioides taihuensis TaxID=1835606 RepID=A0ABW0BJF9_9ACTN
MGCDQRAAWLLATSRLMHPDQELVARARFVEELRARGIPADPTRISRWESGSHPVQPQVSAAYEQILGLSAGSLSAVTVGMRRAFGSQVVLREQVPIDDSGDLESLLDEVTSERPTGVAWQRMATTLTRHGRVFLRHGEWEELATRLVDELARAVGISYVRRFEAAVTLLRHPSSSSPMSRALGTYVIDPDAQVLAPVLNLLCEVYEQQASDLVLRLLHTERMPLRRAAASVAADKLRRGHFGPSSLALLEEHACHRLRHEDPLEGGLDALDLATQLPAASFTTVLESIGDRRVRAQLQGARATSELVAAPQAARVVAEAVACIQADATGENAEPDPMLRRLVREALLHPHKPRRHHAAVLLGASPYRHAVSRACHTMTGGDNSFLAARAWTVLMRVGHAGRRSEIALRALSEGRPALRGRALVNLGLNPEPISPGEARAIIAGLRAEAEQVPVRHGALFALGMSGAEELTTLVDHGSDAVRRGSRWWVAHGPAIHDHVLAPAAAQRTS